MSEIIGKVIKELEHVFDVLKSAIDINRKRIVALEKRIKGMKNKNISREDKILARLKYEQQSQQ